MIPYYRSHTALGWVGHAVFSFKFPTKEFGHRKAITITSTTELKQLSTTSYLPKDPSQPDTLHHGRRTKRGAVQIGPGRVARIKREEGSIRSSLPATAVGPALTGPQV